MTDERRARPRPEPLTPSFATFDRKRGMVELRCRCCGTVIGKPAAIGEQTVRRIKNQTFIETHVQFQYLANYREVDIAVEGGGRHVGNACAACAEALKKDAGLLARFCETDLVQWRSEGVKITALMDRRPVAVLRVADYIKD